MTSKIINRQIGCKRNGKLCPNCGKIHSDMTGKNNPSNNPRIGDKISKSKKGENHPLFGKTYIEYYGEERTKQIVEKRRPKLTGPANPWFGRHHSAETITLLRKVTKGRNMGENHWTNGKGFTDEHRKNLSKAHIGVQALDKHPSWRGGVSFLPYSHEFNGKLKKRIKNRDNYTCQLCSIREEEYFQKLSVHHIDYNKFNLNKNNLITLCRGCNAKVNVHREEWTLFFQNLIKEKTLCLIF